MDPRLRRRAATLLVIALAAAATPARAATLPAGFSEVVFASGLNSPTAMQFAPDGRLFVAQQGGALRVIKNGALLTTPFLTVTVDSAGERGLLGVTFDPNFASNQYVYVYYTTTSGSVHNRVSRFTANGDVALAGSEVVILELDNLSGASNHNGGAIDFGPDGKLYVAVGDNASGANAQTLSNRLGKMLRINADGSIPTDNPFYGTAVGANRAIWAMGLRNPFTFAQNPSGPAPRMFINDVGQGTWEEVNDGIAGANYGWPSTEGYTSNPSFVSPRLAYDHSGGSCAITGGAFYAPPTVTFPSDYLNDYFFADYCGGFIRRLDPQNGNAVTSFATGINSPVDLKVGVDGDLYYLARGSSAVYRVRYGSLAPGITQHPSSRTVSVGQPATFTVVANGTPPLQYQWQRNNQNIAGATSASYTLNTTALSDSGATFRVNVSNSAGNLYSNPATLTVTTNVAPAAAITQPATGTTYAGGTVIAFAGSGTDPEDGARPASAFTWRVDFHHATHVHPFIANTSGIRSGTFTIPTTGETAADVWYRLYLTVTDSGGLSTTVQRDIMPRVVRLTLASSPPGLSLRLDGQPMTAPASVDSVVGVVRSIEAPAQTANGTSYAFTAWADGGPASRTIATPAVSTTYTAAFTPAAVTAPPAVPAGLAAVANGATLTLSWTRAAGATSYRLEAGTASGLANLYNGDVGNIDRLQTIVPPGTYFVRVRSVNAMGTSAPSSQASATVSTTAACAVAPPAPANYSALTGGLLAALSWQPAPGATSYRLDVGSAPGLTNLLSQDIGAGMPFVATSPAGTYYTRIRAVNACGVGAASGEVPVTLSCAAGSVSASGLAVTKAGGVATFTWAAPLGATSYRLQVGTAPGAVNVLDSDVGNVVALSAGLGGVPPGTYYVRVVAMSTCGAGNPSNEVPVAVP